VRQGGVLVAAARTGAVRTRLVAQSVGTRRCIDPILKPGGRMGLDDKLGNKAEEAAGKVKEGVGKATDDESLEAEGKGDQAKSNVKQAGEKIKDAFS
jgi:uncharacterized protein YjbJ (UPF0337 family)